MDVPSRYLQFLGTSRECSQPVSVRASEKAVVGRQAIVRRRPRVYEVEAQFRSAQM